METTQITGSGLLILGDRCTAKTKLSTLIYFPKWSPTSRNTILRRNSPKKSNSPIDKVHMNKGTVTHQIINNRHELTRAIDEGSQQLCVELQLSMQIEEESVIKDKKYALVLSQIPGVLLIALTGAAMYVWRLYGRKYMVEI